MKMMKVFCPVVMAFVVVMAGCLCAWADVSIDEENFPDETFRTYVSNHFDSDRDGVLSDIEIEVINTLYLSNRNITTLKGIENFTDLTELYCYNNQLTALDLSGCTALVGLYCHYNQLTDLDLSNNTALRTLWCDSQTLTIPDTDLTGTGDTTYPYSIVLPSADLSRIYSLDVKDASGADISTDSSDHALLFASIPARITYDYDTQNPNTTTYMDVTISVDLVTPLLGITLTPLSQDSSDIEDIIVSADNVYGTLRWNFTVSSDQDTDISLLSLTSADMKISGSAERGEVENTYTVTVKAWDDRNAPITTAATIIVPRSPVTPTVSPASQTVSAGDAITEIVIGPDSIPSWSFAISGDYALGLSSGDTSITGTIPSDTPAETYTIIVTTDEGQTATATITVQRSPVTPTVSPASQTVSAGEAITEIVIGPDSIPSWGFTVSGDYPLGLSSGDKSITGTIPSDTPAETYTITVTTGEGQTATATITVTAAPRDTDPPSQGNPNKYTFEMTDSLQNAIASAFPGMEIFQLSDSEILSDTWSLNQEDSQEISDMNEYAVLNVPAIMPQNTGVYVLRFTLSGAETGAKIRLQGISQVSVSSLEDRQYKFFDTNGNEIDTVPADRVVYAAIVMSAGTESRGTITSVQGIPRGTVMPVEEEEREGLLETVAEVINIDTSQISFLTEEEIFPAQEPTQEMVDFVEEKDYSIVGKLATIRVDEPGYYVFKVVLSEDLFREIQGLDVDDVSAFGFEIPLEDASVHSSSLPFIFNGVVNTIEILTAKGEKLNKFSLREFFMVGLFNSSQPFTLFLAKSLYALLGLPAGCNAGLGIIGVGAVIAFMIRRRKR